jgi:hypothetical protein
VHENINKKCKVSNSTQRHVWLEPGQLMERKRRLKVSIPHTLGISYTANGKYNIINNHPKSSIWRSCFIPFTLFL